MAIAADRVLQGFPTRSLVVDTNILLLLVVGGVEPARLSQRKRTRSLAVTPGEFRLIQDIVRRFAEVRITPTILAETSNLLGGSDQRDRAVLAEMLRTWIEVYEPSHDVIMNYWNEYLRMGLADAAIIDLATRENVVVLTDDAVLHNDLWSSGGYSVNLAHLRSG